MVKNKKGGSGHKKMARKFVNNNSGPRKLRKAKVKEGEIYAKVLQMYGNGMCNVICIVRSTFKLFGLLSFFSTSAIRSS